LPVLLLHRVRYNESKTARYFSALRQEIRLYHQRLPVRDVYVGAARPR